MNFEDICGGESPELGLQSIQAIAALCSGLDFSEESITSDLMVQIVINSITSQAITPDEQALGKFTGRKLKNVDTRKDWIARERKQLNQLHNLQMSGKAISCPTKMNLVSLLRHTRLVWNIQSNKCFPLAAELNLMCFGGDVKDTFLHWLSPEVPTFMTINNQYYEWYFDKC